MINEGKIDKEKAKRKLALQKKYGQRITIAKQGRDAFLQKDYVAATKKYNEYLSILAELKDLDDIYKLSPAMFDNTKEVTEMLLISHIYWEMSRINEMTPKLQKTFQKSLDQFVKFTINQPYQVLNAEMLRKYIKKYKHTSRQIHALNDAYQQIFVQSKKCFIATMCFGEEHVHTNTLRAFKTKYLNSHFGIKLTAIYYLFSDKLTTYCSHKPFIKILATNFFKPPLIILSTIVRKSFLK